MRTNTRPLSRSATAPPQVGEHLSSLILPKQSLGRGTTKWWRGLAAARTPVPDDINILLLFRSLPGHIADMDPPLRPAEHARQMRRHMELPEVLLWIQLRRRTLGLRFRRQHPVGPYVLDFYCPQAKLAVEIDGYSHEVADRPQRDERRDAWLAGRGVRTIRLPAREVLKDMDGALATIAAALPPQSLRDSSPTRGGASLS